LARLWVVCRHIVRLLTDLRIKPVVVDAGTPVAFTVRRELKAYLNGRLDTFINPPVYTFWSSQGPSVMTMSSALAK
jgi:hypothetical protein